MTDTLTVPPVAAEPTSPAEGGRVARIVLAVAAVCWFVLSIWLLLSPSVPNLAIDVTSSHAHFLTFFWMSFAALGLATATWRNVAKWAVTLVAIGAATELGQAWFVDGRRGSPLDVFYDGLGVAVAGSVLGLLVLVANRRRAMQFAAFSTAASLLMAFALIVASNPTVDAWWECRGRTPPTGEPVVVLESDAGLSGVVGTDSRDLVCALADSEQMTMATEFTSATANQDGPTRIVTLSVGPSEHQVNFHLGQAGTNLSVRLRSDDERKREWETIENVIRPGERQRVEIQIDADTLTIWVDGVEQGSFTYGAIDFELWDHDFPLLVGDEATGEREFVGIIHAVEFYASAESARS